MQDLVCEFMSTFYGYGNLQAPYWYIGMEEGCAEGWDANIAPRFRVWEERGKRTVEDARKYHYSLGIRQFWDPTGRRRVKIQSTWRSLLKTHLSARGETVDEAAIANLQATSFGMSKSDSCLLELLPLPSPDVKGYHYAHLTDENHLFFASRPAYCAHVMEKRIKGLQTLMLRHKPSHVVLYGTSYRTEWEQLVFLAPWTQVAPRIHRCKVGSSNVWMVPHPRARKLPSTFFSDLGAQMRQLAVVSRPKAASAT